MKTKIFISTIHSAFIIIIVLIILNLNKIRSSNNLYHYLQLGACVLLGIFLFVLYQQFANFTKEKNIIKHILNEIPTPVYIIDYTHKNKNNFIHWNKTALKTYGSFLNKSYKSFFDSIIMQEQVALINEQVIKGIPYHGYETFIAKNGKEFYTEVFKRKTYIDGKPMIMVLRHNLNNAIRYKKSLKLILHYDKSNIWRYELKSHKLFLMKKNDEETELYFDDYLERFHNSEIPIVKECFTQLLKGKTDSLDRVLRLRNINQNRIYTSLRIISLKTEIGRVVELIGVEKDVTDEYNYEQLLQNFKVKTNMVTKIANAFQFDYNVQKQVFYLYDKNLGDYKLQTLKDIFRVVPKKEKSKALRIIEEMNEGINKVFEEELQLYINGQLCWTRVFISPFLIEDNKVVKYTAFVSNVNEWKEMVLRTENLKIAAERSDNLKSAFLYNISHEIRTPLNSIVGFSQLLNSTEDKNDIALYHSVIVTNTSLLLRLLDDILELSKIDSGFIEIKSSTFNLTEILDFNFEKHRVAVKESVVFRKEYKSELCNVFLDKKIFSQIITNFLSNAIKFTSSGEIVMGYKKNKNKVQIYVRDTGKGISEKDREKIFERFEKVDMFTQGTGLGLSLAKSLAEKSGGKIWFESTLNKGTTFWLEVPIIVNIDKKKTLVIS